MYSQLGLQNIADEVETSAGPYPQLNAEFIISADPDLIFLACTKYCGETAETVAARPGWGDMKAVTTVASSRWTTTSRRAGVRASSTTSDRQAKPSPSSSPVSRLADGGPLGRRD